jgi:hypothetical protein
MLYCSGVNRTDSLRPLVAGPAARLLVLWQISDVELALARWQMQNDEAGLTQLHQTLRALHDVVRGLASELSGSISRKHVRQLAALARTAQRALLAQTALGTLQQIERLADDAAEIERIEQALEKERKATTRALANVSEEFAEVARRWRRSLRIYRLELDPEVLPQFETFAAVMQRVIGREANQLEQTIASLADADSDGALTKVRRGAERLAHVLEPMRSVAPAVTEASRSLAQLKGLMTSLQAASAVLRSAEVLELNSDGRVRRFFEQLRARLFYDLRRMWLEGNGKWFFQRLQQSVESTAPWAVARSGRRPDPARAESPWRVPSPA